MTLLGGLATYGLAGLAACLVSALARPAWVPVAVTLAGAALLVARGAAWFAEPCTSDPAGCGMSRGYEALILYAAAAPLAAGAVAALIWRLALGPDASLARRAGVLAAVLLAPILAALLFF